MLSVSVWCVVVVVCRAHFEEAMSRARRSVSEADIRKYDTFNQQQKAARGFDEFKFGDGEDAEEAQEGAEEEDMY